MFYSQHVTSPKEGYRMSLLSKTIDDLTLHPASSSMEIAGRLNMNPRSVMKELIDLFDSGLVTRVKRTVYRYTLTPKCIQQLEQECERKTSEDKGVSSIANRVESLEGLRCSLEKKGLYNRAARVCLDLIDSALTDKDRAKYVLLRENYVRLAKRPSRAEAAW